MDPNCYIIAGSNGAGKTTFAEEFLPNWIGCVNFINPDLIAQGLSPFAPEKAMLRAGRLVLEEIEYRSIRGEDFAFETTLSGRTYYRILTNIKERGYEVHMFYLWIPSPELALKRIDERVLSGGHNVPESDVRRRFERAWRNLINQYRALVDSFFIFDNSGEIPVLVCDEIGEHMTIHNQDRYQMIFGSSAI